MAVAAALDLRHPSWVFWSAFVVIAGSAGESLRRVAYRVFGTVAGTTAGVLAIVATPDSVSVSVVLTVVAVFLAIFFAPTSYSAMVFWLSFAVVVVFAHLGAKASDLLVQRPATAALGAAIAAVVALVIIPVRVTGRYRQQLARMLDLTAPAVDAWVEVAAGRADRGPADRATTAVQEAYEVVQRLLPSVAFESNPLVQSRSSLTGQATLLAAVSAALDHLAEVALDEAEHPADTARPLAQEVSTRIRDALTATASVLRGGTATVTSSLADLAHEAEPRPVDAPAGRATLLMALVDLQGAVVELAGASGVPVDHPRRERHVGHPEHA